LSIPSPPISGEELYRREGVSIGAQLVRPDIRQSSSADFSLSSRTSHTPAIANARMMINPISAADLRWSASSSPFWDRFIDLPKE